MSIVERLDALHAKATPGPWTVSPCISDPKHENSRTFWGPEALWPDPRLGTQIGDWWEGTTPNEDIGENAANVDLLLALRNAYPAIARVLKAVDALTEGDYDDCGPVLTPLYEAVRALREVQP